MRERLVLAFVGLTLAVIGLYGIPRAYFLADLVRDQQSDALTAAAVSLDAVVTERLDNGGEVDEELLVNGLVGADRVRYQSAEGDVVVVGQPLTGEGGLLRTRELSDGGRLALSISGDTLSGGVREAITPLVLLGIGLGLAAAIFGFVIARRMALPFQDLAGFSRDLGHGRFELDIPRYSVPEAEAIGSSLRNAGTQLDGLVRREREFAANASHQLRTPITALRLSLEDLTLWPETPPEVGAEIERGLGELDRLSGAIDELLDLARGRRIDAQQTIDVAALVAASAGRWRRQLADEGGRSLVVTSDGPVRTRVAVGPVEQVLDVLVDNARVHGRGTITLATSDEGTHLEVVVGDEGERRIGPEVFQRGVSSRAVSEGHGIGLAVAAELAEVCGGHLSLDTSHPTTRFVLWLPRRDGEETQTPMAAYGLT